jgi:hypothetical protein
MMSESALILKSNRRDQEDSSEEIQVLLLFTLIPANTTEQLKDLKQRK